MTLENLQELFPSKTPAAVTGHIPIEWANSHKEELAEAMKGNKLRRVFRGPRKQKGLWYGRKTYESSTRAEDATAIALYNRSKTLAEWKIEMELRNV